MANHCSGRRLTIVGGLALALLAAGSSAFAQGTTATLRVISDATRAGPHMHRSGRARMKLRPIVVPPDDYTGPDGSYDSHADMVRSIEGTPCGIDCTRHAYERWNPGIDFSANR